MLERAKEAFIKAKNLLRNQKQTDEAKPTTLADLSFNIFAEAPIALETQMSCVNYNLSRVSILISKLEKDCIKELKPKSWREYLSLGINAFHYKKFDQSVEFLKKSLVNVGDNDEGKQTLLITISQLYFAQNDTKQARENISNCIKNYPQNVQGWLTLISMCSQRKDFKAAEAAFQSAKKKCINCFANEDYFLVGAGMYIHQQKWKLALSVVQTACRLFPDSLRAWNLMHFILLNQNEIDFDSVQLSFFCPLLLQVPSQLVPLSGEKYMDFLDSGHPYLQFLKSSVALHLSSPKAFSSQLVTSCYVLLRTSPLSLNLWKLLATSLLLQFADSPTKDTVEAAESALRNTLVLNQKHLSDKEVVFFSLARAQCLCFLERTREALDLLDGLTSKDFKEIILLQKARYLLKNKDDFGKILQTYKESLIASPTFQAFFVSEFSFHIERLRI